MRRMAGERRHRDPDIRDGVGVSADADGETLRGITGIPRPLAATPRRRAGPVKAAMRADQRASASGSSTVAARVVAAGLSPL
jgi:hypothetical protein